MGRSIHALLVLLMVSPAAVGHEEPPPAVVEFDDFMTNYYWKKDATELPRLLKSLQACEFLETHDSACVPFAAFLAVVFQDNPSQVTPWARAADFTGETRRMIQRAMWISGHADNIREVFGDMPKFARGKPVSLEEQPMKEAADLDSMWGAFLGSGDVAYVNKIIDVLDPKHKLDGDRTTRIAVRRSAEWSLRSNMMRHELVHRLIHDQAKTRTGGVRTKLEAMLKQVQKVRLRESEGDFTAQMYLMDEAGMQEFAKPVDQAPRLSSRSKARRGDVIGIKIVFAGIALSDDLKADVRYDLKILDPDVEIYDKTDLTDLEGLSQKVPTRFRLYDNLQVVAVKFEPNDKLGTYRVLATVYDKIGKRTVKLKELITLEE